MAKESIYNEENFWVPSSMRKKNIVETTIEQPGVYLPNSNIISGTGIEESGEEGESVDDMLKSLNEQNKEAHAEETERLRKEQEAKEAEDKRIREEAQAKFLQERYEEELAVREKMRQEEEEEERRLAEEAEAKRKANPLYRMKEAAATRTAKKKDEKEQKAQNTKKKQKNNIPQKENPLKKEENTPKHENENIQESPDFEYLATHDKLTGMKNYTAYEMAIKACNPAKLAILFFDVNDLKLTNDTLGHAMGNKLITTASGELGKLFPEQVYRIGGDEFVVLYEVKKPGTAPKELDEKIAKFQASMTKATKEDEDGLIYSVSVGYAIGDGKKSAEEIQEEADKAMYAHKQAYKSSKKKKEPKKKKEEAPAPDHDSLLTEEQRQLKGVIKDNHVQVSEESTEKILREIQMRCNEILAVLVASPTFDHLFIMQDVESFINLVAEMDNLVDYSYLYVVYENGTQFYGSDEYFDEVTVLFTEIGKVLKTSRFVSDKELLKVKDINMFRNIYID